jgi:hypothetical protein
MPQISMTDAVDLILATMQSDTVQSNLLLEVRDGIKELEELLTDANGAIEEALCNLDGEYNEDDVFYAVQALKAVVDEEQE